MGIAHVRDETVQTETGLLRQRGSALEEGHLLPASKRRSVPNDREYWL